MTTYAQALLEINSKVISGTRGHLIPSKLNTVLQKILEAAEGGASDVRDELLSAIEAAVAPLAPINSPEFTGSPTTAGTPLPGDRSDKIPNTQFVMDAIDAAIDDLVGGAPAALDTLNEIAAALNDDADIAATLTSLIATKVAGADLSSASDAAKGSALVGHRAGGGLPGGTVQEMLDILASSYETVAALQAATVPAVQTVVRVAGYWAAGDGGHAMWQRISTPSPVEAWHKQSADGAYWKLVPDEGYVNARAMGCKGDGVTVDTVYAQATMDYARTFSNFLATPSDAGGAAYFPAGDYRTGPLTIYSNVKVFGDGILATSFRKNDPSSATYLMQTEGYASLVGTDAWFLSEGVVSGFGLFDFSIDGGAYPPTSHDTDRGGVRIYGKGYSTRILIRNINGVGFWTECGSKVGQSEAADMPESTIDVRNYRTGGHGVVNRGPHDGHWSFIYGSSCGISASAVAGAGNGSGYWSEYSSGLYAGHGEIDKLHTYGCKDPVRWERRHKCNILTSENCSAEALVIAGDQHSSINQLEVYSNCHSTGSEQVRIEADKVTILHFSATQATDVTATFLKVTGSHVSVNGIEASGDTGKSAIGIDNEGSFNSFRGFLRSFGTGVRQASGVTDNDYNLKIRDFTTMFNALGQYLRCDFNLDAYSATAATIWGGTAPTGLTSTQYRSCMFNVRTVQNGTNYNLRNAFGRQGKWIPASEWLPRTTNGPAQGTTESTTHKVMSRTLDFDPNTAEYAQHNWRPPKRWDKGTISAKFYWSHPSTTTNFQISMALDAQAQSDGDTIDSAFGTAQSVLDTGGTTEARYISPETNAITIAGSPADEDEVLLRVWRNAAGGNDTLAVDAKLHGVMLYWNAEADNDF